MRFAQELRFAALENIRLSDSNAADCDAELQAVRAEIALLEDAADPATAGKEEVDERRDISSKEIADATVLARLPGMTREQLEEELYSRAGPKVAGSEQQPDSVHVLRQKIIGTTWCNALVQQ